MPTSGTSSIGSIDQLSYSLVMLLTYSSVNDLHTILFCIEKGDKYQRKERIQLLGEIPLVGT